MCTALASFKVASRYNPSPPPGDVHTLSHWTILSRERPPASPSGLVYSFLRASLALSSFAVWCSAVCQMMIFGCTCSVLTFLQLYWGYKVVAATVKMLKGDRSDREKEA